jgi:hypothetical protein
MIGEKIKANKLKSLWIYSLKFSISPHSPSQLLLNNKFVTYMGMRTFVDITLSWMSSSRKKIRATYNYNRGTWYHSLLRHYTTSWKVVGSISDEVSKFFSWPNHSSCTMALGSTQPLTEMSTRNLTGGKWWLACKTDSLTAIYEPIV